MNYLMIFLTVTILSLTGCSEAENKNSLKNESSKETKYEKMNDEERDAATLKQKEKLLEVKW
jgi:hypothetical protein